jgi:rod shape determining protein RodA
MDPVLVSLIAFLVAVGCVFVFGTSRQSVDFAGDLPALSQLAREPAARQIAFAGLGVLCLLFITKLTPDTLESWAWPAYLGALFLLVLVLFVGHRINNARSWLPLLGGFRLQPSELAKPATILALAHLASRPHIRARRVRHALLILGVACIPAGLTMLQPDHGTALVFFPLALVVVFLAGVRWKLIVLGIVLALLALPLTYRYGLRPHQKERIQTFLNPSENVSEEGYNAHQSLLAVGSGGLWGKGYRQGTQHVLGFLPRTVAPTDFIFSVIGEETGFAGSATVVTCFLVLILCCVRTAAVAADDFGAYLAAGAAAMFATHVFINVGMTIGAAPIIGIPLPFVSYGGSFMLGCMLTIGLVQNAHVHRPESP